MSLSTLLSIVSKVFTKKEADAEVQMSPSGVCTYLSVALVLLMILGCSFPQSGITVSPNLTLTFPGIAEWLSLRADNVDKFTINLKSDDFLGQLSSPTKTGYSALPAQCTPDKIKELPVQPIAFPPDRQDLFTSVWQSFRGAGRAAAPMRILHYGDSQLEADRISSALRAQFQQRFGGGGIGYVALNPTIPVNPTVNLTLSEGWIHSASMVKYTQRNAAPTGHLLSNAMLLPNTDHGWIKIERRAIKSYKPLQFSQVRMLVLNTDAQRIVEVCTPSRKLYETVITPQTNVQQITANIGNSRESIIINFKGQGRTVVYGVAMDMSNGIALDNIPLRASMGLDFVKADVDNLRQCYDFLNVRLIILQFGVNIVPHNNTNYKYYEEQLYRQLYRLRQALPRVPILVVGVSDIARRGVGGVLASYPNIEQVRDAQYRAAMRAECGFWDTYTAMGGQNSIIAWAYSKPSLATKDFCHFNQRGTVLLAELMFRAMTQ
jgi:hypothetical protein